MRNDTRPPDEGARRSEGDLGPGRDGGGVVRVISSGTQALDAVMLERGRLVAERVILIEREDGAGPADDPIDPRLQTWAQEEGSIVLGDQKIPVKRLRLRQVRPGEVRRPSDERRRAPGPCSEERLEQIRRGVSAQTDADSVIPAAAAVGGAPSAGSRPLGGLTAPTRTEVPERALDAFTPGAIVLDTRQRGGDAVRVVLGGEIDGQQLAVGGARLR